MGKSFQFTAEQIAELEAAKASNRDKNIDKRLTALLMRASGKRRKEIAERIGMNDSYISKISAKYMTEGLEGIVGNHYHGNRRYMSFEEESKILEEFTKKAEAGQVISIQEIKDKYVEAVGHEIVPCQIYRVLKRHGWRKVMPRSRHPKKATEEAIDASKKLTLESQN